MWRTLRVPTVPKNTTAQATQTTAIRMSIGHSSSAYSLPVVMPSGSVMAASTMTSCQPQKVNIASRARTARVWQVRWTTWYEVANSVQPPNAKITALVCRAPYTVGLAVWGP